MPFRGVSESIRLLCCTGRNILKEIYTGTKKDGRKEWVKLLKMLRSGGTVYFDSISRMSRNADEGLPCSGKSTTSAFVAGLQAPVRKEREL